MSIGAEILMLIGGLVVVGGIIYWRKSRRVKGPNSGGSGGTKPGGPTLPK